MDGARTGTAAGNRAAGRVAMATAPKLRAPAFAKDVTRVTKTWNAFDGLRLRVEFLPVAVEFFNFLRPLVISPRTLRIL